jgi:hypothetical protein
MYKFIRCHVVIFHGFLFPMTDFLEILAFHIIHLEISMRFLIKVHELLANSADNLVNSAEFRFSSFFYSFHVSAVFSRIFLVFTDFFNFTKFDGFGTKRIFMIRRIFKHCTELQQQLGEELPNRLVNRGECVPVDPQHLQHQDFGHPRHQHDRAQT